MVGHRMKFTVDTTDGVGMSSGDFVVIIQVAKT